MKKFLLPTILGLAVSVPSFAADSWTGQDKAKHLVVSTAIGSATYALTEDRIISYMTCVGIGVTKEYLDQNTSGFSEKDLAIDALGCIIGVEGVKVYKDRDAVGVQFSYDF